MLKDEDARVLPAVLEAMRKARGTDAADTLKRHLEHPDFAVRAAAAEGLAALKTTGLTPALAAAYQRALGDRDIDARAAVVAALAIQKDDAAKAALRDAPPRATRRASCACGRRPPSSRLGEAPRAPGARRAWTGPPSTTARRWRPTSRSPGVPLYTPRAILHTRSGRIEIHLNIVEAPLTAATFIEPGAARLLRRPHASTAWCPAS